MTVAYALFDSVKKVFMSSNGYYGNEINIKCFKTKEEAEHYIKVYTPRGPWKPRRVRVS